MEFLGIGPSELIFIIIIAIIVLGPKDMQKAGKTIGKWMRDIVTSDGWKAFQQTSREVRNLPTRLMREANEELEKIGEIDPNPARNRTMPKEPAPVSKQAAPPAETSIPVDSPAPGTTLSNPTGDSENGPSGTVGPSEPASDQHA